MKTDVLNEIRSLRGDRPDAVDFRNSNRYRLVMRENDGSRTAYYFGTPIYNVYTGKLLDSQFQKKDAAFSLVGSNSEITVSQEILLENGEGICRASLHERPSYASPWELRTGQEVLRPTSNGVTYRVKCSAAAPYRLRMSVNRPFLQIWKNKKCFALMNETYIPFMAVSCIGTVDDNGFVTAPAEIVYQKISDREYELAITPCIDSGQWVLFEVNLYEAKLFQDTTVESGNPDTNNAFGGTAFIGNTEAYGEQWLYTRPDFSKMPEILDCKIAKAILHLPKFSESNVVLSAHSVSSRFCSFGSNWDNKVVAAGFVADSYENGEYMDLDITRLLTDEKTGFLNRSEGLILKTKRKGSGFAAVATGDCYYTPQILEIGYL